MLIFLSADNLDGAVPSVVLGKVLSRKLGVAIGDELTLLGQGHDGSLSASVLRITGIFDSGSDVLDGSVAMLRLPEFQEIFSRNANLTKLQVSSIQNRPS